MVLAPHYNNHRAILMFVRKSASKPPPAPTTICFSLNHNNDTTQGDGDDQQSQDARDAYNVWVNDSNVSFIHSLNEKKNQNIPTTRCCRYTASRRQIYNFTDDDVVPPNL